MESMVSLFGTPGDRSALAPAARVPTIPVDIREDDKAIYVTADAPGLGKGDIKVGQGVTARLLGDLTHDAWQWTKRCDCRLADVQLPLPLPQLDE